MSLLLLAVSASGSKAQSTNNTPSQEKPTKVRNSDSDIYFKEFPGCPDNSICNAELGNQRLNWRKNLKEGKIKVAIPYHFLMKGNLDHNENPPAILWHLPCYPKEKNSTQRTYRALTYIKHIKEIDKIKNVITLKIYQLNNKGKVIKVFPTLHNEYPLLYRQKKLWFLLQEEQKYYSISVTQAGALKIHKDINYTELPRNISCPSETITKLKLKKKEVFCKALWNADSKKYQTFIFPRECS